MTHPLNVTAGIPLNGTGGNPPNGTGFRPFDPHPATKTQLAVKADTFATRV
jgi:hypothetical protein